MPEHRIELLEVDLAVAARVDLVEEAVELGPWDVKAERGDRVAELRLVDGPRSICIPRPEGVHHAHIFTPQHVSQRVAHELRVLDGARPVDVVVGEDGVRDLSRHFVAECSHGLAEFFGVDVAIAVRVPRAEQLGDVACRHRERLLQLHLGLLERRSTRGAHGGANRCERGPPFSMQPTLKISDRLRSAVL